MKHSEKYLDTLDDTEILKYEAIRYGEYKNLEGAQQMTDKGTPEYLVIQIKLDAIAKEDNLHSL